MRSVTICALVFTLWTFAAFAASPPPASADPPGGSIDERIAASAKANAESWGTPDPAAFVGEKGAVTQLDNTRAFERIWWCY